MEDIQRTCQEKAQLTKGKQGSKKECKVHATDEKCDSLSETGRTNLGI